jgi:hypothetical protein
MTPITVVPIFLPNGKTRDGKLQYSIWLDLQPPQTIPLDAETLKELYRFPEFLRDLQLQIVSATGVVLPTFTVNPGDAGRYWTALFTSRLTNIPWNPLANTTGTLPQTNYTTLPATAHLQNFINRHHAKRLLDKNLFAGGSWTVDESAALTAYGTMVQDSCKDGHGTMQATCKDIRERIDTIGHPPAVALAGQPMAAKAVTEAPGLPDTVNQVFQSIKRLPYLLRLLGLLLDNTHHGLPVIDAAQLPENTNAKWKCVRVNKPSYTGIFKLADAAVIVPTNVWQKGTLFLASATAPNTSLFTTGSLNLTLKNGAKNRFALVQNNGAEVAHKEGRMRKASAAGSSSTALPPQHTNGLYLVDDLRDGINAYLGGLPTADPAGGYFLEHLLIGFRFDLRNAGDNNWKNLNSAYNEFTIQGTVLPADPSDKGSWTNFSAVSSTKDGHGFMSEVLCHYNGWGLSSHNPLQDAALQEKKKRDPSGLNQYLKSVMQVNTKQPASSLLPLRVGNSYVMQARLVTIDGYSILPGEGDKLETAPCTYGRLDAVSPSVLVLREPPTTGESHYTLVIHSDNNSRPSPQRSRRGLAPGSISWHIAEWMGAFDKGNKDYADVDLIMRSENFLPKYKGHAIIPGTGSFKAGVDERQIVPHLTDPWACGFEIICAEDSRYSVAYASNKDLKFWSGRIPWWQIGTWDIVIREAGESPGPIPPGSGGVEVDAYNRVIKYSVPKGLKLTFTVRAFPLDPTEFIQGSASINAIIAEATTKLANQTPAAVEAFATKIRALLATVYPAANAGANPVRVSNLFSKMNFTAIHAVKTPLRDPAVVGPLLGARTWNPQENSYALLSGNIFYPDATAGKLVLFASWKDEFDVDGAAASKTYKERRVGEFILDGKISKTDICAPSAPLASWILGSVVTIPLAPGTKPPPPADVTKEFYMLQNFGDTRHRVVEYRLGAVTRFTPYFPVVNGEHETDFSAFSKSVQVNILASKAPPAPKVLFIVPTFKWDIQHEKRTRSGNRLRVYLDRPWLASGPGEQLAVVLPGNPSYANETVYEPYVSKWGRDVTTGSANLAALAPEHFVGASPVKTLTIDHPAFKQRNIMTTTPPGGVPPCLTITDQLTKVFQAIPLDVHYDPSLKVWYSEIEFADRGAYCPFIQLALARYQANAIAGEELSAVVLCQFTQVAPTRSVTTQRQGSSITVSLTATAAKFATYPHPGVEALKNQAYIRFVPREDLHYHGEELIYTVERADATTDHRGWKPMTDVSISGAGEVVWTYKGEAPFEFFGILIKEFETFDNADLKQTDPEADPGKRLVYGDYIEWE